MAAQALETGRNKLDSEGEPRRARKFLLKVVVAVFEAAAINIPNSLSVLSKTRLQSPPRRRINVVPDTAEHVQLHGHKIMENNIDLMLRFFIIRPSLEAGAHLASVECVAHYLMVPGFYRDWEWRCCSLHICSHGIAVMCSLSEMDLFLMTGVGLRCPAELILCEKKRASAS